MLSRTKKGYLQMRAKLTRVDNHPPGLQCFEVEIDWEAIRVATAEGWTCKSYLRHPVEAAKWWKSWRERAQGGEQPSMVG